MRLVQLNLRAYGSFTNEIVNFETAPHDAIGKPGLHIIFGGNEAGKSTALRALRAVLFGMNDMRDAHLHPKDMLRVSLTVQTAGGEILNVERRKGRGAKSLLFVDTEKAMPVEEWARVLPVDSVDLFEQMFALNYERLVEGGRQLAGFQNDVGQALLAAAGDLGQTLLRMRDMLDRAETIYNPRATSSKLRLALSAYQEADKKFRDERYTCREYKAAVARRDEIEEELKRIASDRIRCSEELHRLTRVQAAAPHVYRLIDDEKALETFTSSVLLDADFEQRFTDTISDLRGAQGRHEEAAFELGRLTLELEAIPRDSVLAGLAPEIDRWKDLSGKILAAREDCPKREAELKRLSSTREGLSHQLGVTADAIPRLLVEQRKQIELLAGQKLVLEAKRSELPSRIANFESSLAEAELVLDSLAEEADTTDLAERLSQVRSRKQPEAEVKRLRLERDQFVERLRRDLKSLPLWSGTADQLETLRVPLNASVSEFTERFIRHQTRSQQLTEEQRSINAEIESCSSLLSRLECQESIPTESELTDVRARRDVGWTAVKERWLQGLDGGPAETTFLETSAQSLPDAYEAAILCADSIADRLRFEADRVEQKRSVVELLESAKQRLIKTECAFEQHRAELARVEAEWTGIWAEAGITPYTPKEMQAWLETRMALVGQSRDLRRLTGQLMEAESEVKQWQESLGAVLGETSDRTLADLVNRAETRLREAAENRKNRSEATSRIRQLKLNSESAKEEQCRNASDLEKWQSSWVTALHGLPISSTADPTAAQEILRIIDQVVSTSDEIAGLQYRIDAMKADEAAYVGMVHGLAMRAERRDLAACDALYAIGELQTLARVALSNESKRMSVDADVVREKRKLEGAQNEAARHETTLEALRKEAQAQHANALPAVIRADRAHRELLSKIEGHRAALAHSCGNITLEAFIAHVQSTNLDLLPAELEQIREETNRLEDARAKNVSERDSIDKEFQLREAATVLSNAACQKFSAAARIDALATEYLEQQVGAKLLARAVASYREKNQDPLLKLAGKYFSTLTCGSFSCLAIDDVGSQRTLRGIRASNGDHLDLDAMSDGTRDQLFLALRLAYIENQCDQGMLCPVILDDVLMAFDDRRADAALRALRDLSKKTQVLVFTHHAHHVGLAQNVLAPSEYCLHNLVGAA